MRHELRLDDPTLRARIAALIRDARLLVGWRQADLADRARTSQSRIARLGVGRVGDIDIAVAARILTALGMPGTLAVEDRHLDDRRAQRTPVHGILLGYAAARLRRWGWQTATEARIGGDTPRGWIDLLGYRPADESGLIGEIKGDIPDPGALQRQVAFYEREANAAMRSMGWRPRRIATLVLALDSSAVHDTLRSQAQLIGQAFPGSPVAMADWLADPAHAPPPRALALADPRTRREAWLLRSPVSGRRSPPAFATYREAAAILTAQRRRGGLPRTRPSSSRSRSP